MRDRMKYGISVLLFCLLLPCAVSLLGNGMGRQEIQVEKQGIFIIENRDYGTEKVDEETYLIGALAASIPEKVADKTAEGQTEEGMHMEALKAMAVVLRSNLYETYAREGEKSRRCVAAEKTGQPCLTPRQMRLLWGNSYEMQLEKYQRAVQETEGERILYNGQTVRAPYFSVSAGKTRDGREALREQNVPYLKAVECPMDVFSPSYSVRLTYSSPVFEKKLEEIGMEQKKPEQLLLERDQSGYVVRVIDSTSGKSIPGEAFRSALFLPSACFEMEQSENKISFTVQGQGHGIGLSQYGANVLAGQGKNHEEILRYFFQEIQIQK